MRRHRLLPALLILLFIAGPALAGGTLRIGLNEDPDALDPARSGTFVGRIVFAATCDKLVDLDAQDNFVPQLATAWQWSPDGLALTMTLATACNSRTAKNWTPKRCAPTSSATALRRKACARASSGPLTAVEVVDPHTVRLHLSKPYAPLVAVLSDRAGMMLAPQAMARLGSHVENDLPCAGPFKLTERVAQDRIVVDRFPGYWNASAVSLDRIIYQPIPDTTVRLVNLEAGKLDMVERLGPTDVAKVKANPHLRLVSITALAFYALSINLAADGPLAHDPTGARGAGGLDRSRGAQSGGDGWAVHALEPVRGAGHALLEPAAPGAAARRSEGEGAAGGGRHAASWLYPADRQQPGGGSGR